MLSKRTRFMWKNKVVSEKVYKKRIAQREAGKRMRKNFVEIKTEEKEHNHDEPHDDANDSTQQSPISHTSIKPLPISNKLVRPGEGNRIVDLLCIGQQLWCNCCKECLSLANIENEERRGLGSTLSVRCHKCLLINIIVTGEQHSAAGVSRRNSRYDVNTKSAIGMVQGGIGFANLNKYLECLNIPKIAFSTFKRYEAEARQALEPVAQESCS